MLLTAHGLSLFVALERILFYRMTPCVKTCNNKVVYENLLWEVSQDENHLEDDLYVIVFIIS